MAIGWLAVLQLVPWADIIRNAPKVAEGAKKLWSAVGKKSPTTEASSETASPAFLSDSQALSALHAQLEALEGEVSELHSQMVASTELIKALADQNTELIKHVEANRIKILWLTGTAVILGIAVAASLVLTLIR